MLLATLQSIASQSQSWRVADVVVVTSDAVREADLQSALVRNNSAVGSLHIVPMQDGTIASMRNRGAQMTGSSYLAFVDADIELEEGWIETMFELVRKHPATVVFAGVQVPDREGGILHRMRSGLSQMHIGPTVASLPGANLFISTKAFRQSNRFPEELVSCEDVTFTSSLRGQGELRLTAKTGFVHLGEDCSFRQLFGKEMFRGESNLLTAHVGPGFMRELPSLLAPLMVLAGGAGMLLALVTNAWGFALQLFLLFLTPIVAYSIRFHRARKTTRVSLFEAFRFYLVYFLGRGVGMLLGSVKSMARKN